MILSSFDRVLINTYVGRSEAGLYAYAYQISQMLYILIGAFNSSWTPGFYERMKTGQYAAIRKSATRYIAVFTGISILIIIGSPIVLEVLSPKSYWQAKAVAPVVTGGTFFVFIYTLFAGVLLYEKRTWLVTVGTTASAVVNTLLNIALIPTLGYMVAGWTTLVAYFVMLLLYIYFCRSRTSHKNLFNLKVIFASCLVIVGVSALMFVLSSAVV
jgi:O-antigen/teichoic acid export membrane protein